MEGAIKMLHTNKTLAQQHQVDENVLKVRLNHADNMLKQEGSNIYNLHKQQLELETVRTFLIIYFLVAVIILEVLHFLYNSKFKNKFTVAKNVNQQTKTIHVILN